MPVAILDDRLEDSPKAIEFGFFDQLRPIAIFLLIVRRTASPRSNGQGRHVCSKNSGNLLPLDGKQIEDHKRLLVPMLTPL